MDTEGNSSSEVGLNKPRSILGELTNQLPTKRPFPLNRKIDSNVIITKRPRISEEIKDPNLFETINGKPENPPDLAIVEESAESFHDEKTDETKTSLTPSYENDSDDYGDGFVMSQSGSMDWNFVPESQESRVFAVVDKSSETNKADVCVKDCTCSFCTKAAHIWLDLNYQDIKARVSATTRIQKEAMMLSERICRSKGIERHGVESSTSVAGLESNLRQHWRSLFQHMSGVWEKEGHQMEASLLPVAELREKLKTELELIATPFEKK